MIHLSGISSGHEGSTVKLGTPPPDAAVPGPDVHAASAAAEVTPRAAARALQAPFMVRAPEGR